jgi:hypothetical protein
MMPIVSFYLSNLSRTPQHLQLDGSGREGEGTGVCICVDGVTVGFGSSECSDSI